MSDHLGQQTDNDHYLVVAKFRERLTVHKQEMQGFHTELKKHMSWFDKGCSKLLYKREQAKLQWLQGSSEIKGNNNNNKTKLMSLQKSMRTRDL
jgi:hypothetical protein